MLKGKKILIGVTGSIAAYKAAFLIRLLVKRGAKVRVIMTETAKEFITPLTLATLSKTPVLTDFFNPENGDWNSHVDLGNWADAFLIAPATANSIAKLTHGIADNLLLTTYLSAKCKVFVVPAMDLNMLNHITTRENIQKLKDRGNTIIEPASGELASGLEGKGRMEEPEEIVKVLEGFFNGKLAEKKNEINRLSVKKVLVTAGPTYEPFDPVRYISNHSTGKMGYSVAEAFAQTGCEVFLVSGPTNLSVPSLVAHSYRVQTSDEMFNLSKKIFKNVDIAVFSAAVADYKPARVSSQKIKSKSKKIDINLVPTVDIAFELGKVKRDQFTIGFALETEDETKNAKKKLVKKNLDLIVLNSLQDEGAGFGYDTNKITVIDKYNNIYKFGLKTKDEVAFDILKLVNETIQ
ncbi:MAG: bifunctional phosphopantothenoylcysteine decarboxylase/phosphopantothenate--cysteine ligase CoaBC [Bacteroidales bacterium]|nr:bifunctional phosphopantothenoylcysteine decarboxylase/phosphopantothenate--cysteine ligase CoaBC [Bacteroidales bacterium]